MMRLIVEDLRYSYGSRPVLKGIQIGQLWPGQVTAIIGPNAAGKSTLFKCLAGMLRGDGRILIDGLDCGQLKREEIARRVTYLPQENASNAALTVFEAVLLARQHSVSWRVSDDDLMIVSETLASLEIAELALRYLNELSGGQRQMVSIAQALVRDPSILLMDEPTNNLDLQRQLEVLELIRAITLERGITTLIALHDLNMAARYADYIIVVNDGRVYASGTANSILTPEMLRDIYGIHASVSLDSDGYPVVIPLASARQRAASMTAERLPLLVS